MLPLLPKELSVYYNNCNRQGNLAKESSFPFTCLVLMMLGTVVPFSMIEQRRSMVRLSLLEKTVSFNCLFFVFFYGYFDGRPCLENIILPTVEIVLTNG